MKLFAVLAVFVVAGSQFGASQGKPVPTSNGVSAAPIQFEDATEKARIEFTHSFGSRQLGSLLEGTD